MLNSALIGVIAAVFVSVPWVLRPATAGAVQWYSPFWMLAVGGFALVMAWRRRVYTGLPDLVLGIHHPGQPWLRRWGFRAGLSFLFALFGAPVGPEGAAAAAGHGTAVHRRSRNAHWSESVRRTDAAVALAAAISAAFGAPFAAFVLVLELGIGGRAVSAAFAAIVSYVAMRLLVGQAPHEALELAGALYGFSFQNWREWIGVVAIGVSAGVISVLTIRGLRLFQNSLRDFSRGRNWVRLLVGVAIVFLLAWIHPEGHRPPMDLFEDILWVKKSGMDVAFLFCVHILTLAAVLCCFGTLGLFWPVFALGGFLGFVLHAWVLQTPATFAAAAGLVGGAALWGGFLGAPVAGAVLAFEVTQNFYVLLPALLGGLIAFAVRRALKTRCFHETELSRQGFELIGGRWAKIMEAIRVSHAMVTDHETVHERDVVSVLHDKLLRARYPFLPVVNDRGEYAGLLTVDSIEDAWNAHDPQAANSPLARLLEAKDILYRTGQKVPVLMADDRLSATVGRLEQYPCLPVLDDQRRVLGLLFAHNVRLAYDREVARSTLVPHELKV